MYLLLSNSIESSFLTYSLLAIFGSMLLMIFMSNLSNLLRPRVIVIDSSQLVSGCFLWVLLFAIAAAIALWFWLSPHQPSTDDPYSKLVPQETPEAPHTQKDTSKKHSTKSMNKDRDIKRNGWYSATGHSLSFKKAQKLANELKSQFRGKEILIMPSPPESRESPPKHSVRVGPFEDKKKAEAALRKIVQVAQKI